ncbi:MAG: WbwB [Rhodocyclaceae bacterium]|nr:WbwB [Rhodocyclaceae bacterium]
MPGAAEMRIGLLIDSLVGGGAERMALNFAEKFRDLGHEAHLFILRNDIQHDAGDIPVHIVTETDQLVAWRPLNKWLLAQALRRAVARVEAGSGPFDFFISNAEDMDRLSRMAGLPWVLIRYRNSLREYIAAKVGTTTGLKRRVRSWRWTRKFRGIYGGRHIVAISKEMARELTEDCGIRPASMTTIYNPFNFERIRALADEPAPDLPNEPYIIYVARFCARKDQETLLRAYVQAGVTQPLVLLGGTTSPHEEAYKAHIERLIGELGLTGKVIIPGFRTNPYPWIKHAALFAMSSRSEGLPLVLVEALVLGVPVVSTDCPTGPDEILVGEFARFLSPVGDPAALAANIRQALLAYPASDDSLIAKFSDDVAIDHYLTHFATLSGKEPSPAAHRS